MSNPRNAQVTRISFLVAFSQALRDHIWYNSSYAYEYAITNPEYKRMQTMKNLLDEAGPQEQVLSLRKYYLDEYRRAFAKVGHISDKSPGKVKRPLVRKAVD